MDDGAQRSKVTEQMSPKHLVRPIKTKTETLFEAHTCTKKTATFSCVLGPTNKTRIIPKSTVFVSISLVIVQ